MQDNVIQMWVRVDNPPDNCDAIFLSAVYIKK